MKRNRDILLMFWDTKAERDLIHRKMEQLGTGNLSAYLRKMTIDEYAVKLDFRSFRR